MRARDRDLPSLQRNEPLGEAVTDQDGFYRIEYAAGQFSRAEKASADLQVRVYPPNIRITDRTPPLAESATHFNAKPDETIDLVVAASQYRGPSMYERLLAVVSPLVEPISIADLTAEDIEFLAGESGEDGKQIALLVQSHRLALDVEIPAAVLYGWFYLGLPTDWEALQRQRISTLRKTTFDALDQNIIPSTLREAAESILARVPNPQISELATVLGGAALEPQTLRAVLTQVDGLEAVSDEVLTRLVEQTPLTEPEARRVGLHVSLQRLAGGEPSLVATMLEAEFPWLESGKPQQARDLALLEPEDWEQVLEKADSPLPLGMTRGQGDVAALGSHPSLCAPLAQVAVDDCRAGLCADPVGDPGRGQSHRPANAWVCDTT